MDVNMSQEDEPASPEFPQTFEILEMIFMHLPGELNGLKEVCQRFNHVITYSVPLLKRCQLQWSNDSDKYFRSTGRKFCNVRFSELQKGDASKVLKFVKHHQLTLSKIEFDDYVCKLTAKKVHKFLSLVAGTIKDFALLSPLESSAETPRLALPKLESLALRYDAVNFFDYIETDPELSMPKLRKLEYTDYFIYDDFEEDEKTSAAMIEFLRNSDRLEILKVEASLTKRVLTEFARSPFKFQLKALELEMHDYVFVDYIDSDSLRQFMTPELPSFLASQFNSLTHLTIRYAALHSSDLNAVLRLRIKHLEIDCCWFELDEDNEELKNRTIKEFVFRRLTNDDLHSKEFPQDDSNIRDALLYVLIRCFRLQSIELHDASLSLSCTVCMSKMLLKNLKLEHCKDLFPLCVPKLKTLTVIEQKHRHHSARELEEIMHLILSNPQLKKITVPKSFRDKAAFRLVSGTIDKVLEYQ